MSIPTPVSADGKLQNQRPAPPVNREDTKPTIPSERYVERGHDASTRFNTIGCPAQLWAEWVMEAEMPNPATDEFLQWPTRRAFVDDKVQIRIQINGHVLAAGAEVTVVLRRKGGPAGEEVLRIVSKAPAAALPPGVVVRPLTSSPRALSKMRENETESNIYFEPDRPGHRSYLATTIKLPVRPAGGTGEHDSEFYVASVDLRHHAAHYSVDSPPIEVRRWWATADQNLGLPRTTADSIEDLIDGETYFQQVADELGSAGAGDSIYIAGWCTNALVSLTGGSGAPAAAVAATDFDTAISKTLVGHIRKAAAAGANVYVLLDFFHSWPGMSLIAAAVDKFSDVEKGRIFIRGSTHPYRPSLGVGPFKTPPEQVGSYHEKYVCRVGATYRALLGGIDFGLDQFSPQQHGWVCDLKDHQQLLLNTVGQGDYDYLFLNDLMPWHDIAVSITGREAVQYLQDDFVRRWNEGLGEPDLKGVGHDLSGHNER